MKFNPLFLLGVTLAAFYGPAAAQTTPTPAPNARPGKGVPPPKRATTPPRTASVSAVQDTAAFRRSGRPADGILMRAQDFPSKKKN
ncbi:hypothetical protein F1C16_22425 (plasmid) [Hymenobacter sp. NBH84]|uniref:hypothetical protein n=1 Tax=Hymenobacter sp. NBH84 TaxID=2596915 RepID=UPI001625127B|nr:hypothetical protein [Hymenobacter sp. NBH84]QNE42378.1 hypothetical protein F1C16_22425 [Hymenobacter sp. NBH84]